MATSFMVAAALTVVAAPLFFGAVAGLTELAKAHPYKAYPQGDGDTVIDMAKVFPLLSDGSAAPANPAKSADTIVQPSRSSYAIIDGKKFVCATNADGTGAKVCLLAPSPG
ncbi:MAG: hypothetical protein WCD70_00625, partial [Alphaproteobacteria bacterium]